MNVRRPISAQRQRVELFASAAIAAIVLGVSAAGAQSYKATHVMVSNNNGFINDGATTTDVVVNTTNTVIQWTVPGGSGTYDFQDVGSVTTFNINGSSDYTVLNVVNIDPSRAIRFNGTTNSLIGSAPGGHIWFYSPGGIIVGSTASFNVGSLLLSTSSPSDQTANFTTGAISLSGAPNTASAISIEAGASITANNYIAMVAPHIDQAGTVRGGGQIAYVAAEQANLTFPVSGSNLFTIDIPMGSDAVNAQGQVLVHTGTTGGPGTTPDRDIYFVAMPKNTAITTLLRGTIGYDAASAAVSSEGIYLVGGGAILNGVPYRNTDRDPLPGRLDETPVNLTITNGATFLQNVNAYATNISTQATGGNILFTRGATLAATLTNTLSVGSGLQIASDGSLSLYARGRDANDSLIGGTITATIAGNLRIGASVLSTPGLLLSARSAGADGVLGAITGGTVTVSVAGGTINAGQGGISLDAEAYGGAGTSGDAAGGTGGSATLALAGTINSGGAILLSADGHGGSAGHGQSGAGLGGLARLTAAPGSGVTTPSINAQSVTIRSDGRGGDAYCDTCSEGALGGNGTGGSALLSLTDTNLTADGVGLSAAGEGGISWAGQYPALPGKGGDGAGGLASATFIRGTVTTSNISIMANGTGGRGGTATEGTVGPVTTSGNGGDGGTGTGGRAADGKGALLNFSGSTLLAGEGVPGILLSADAVGGEGGRSADGTGGNGGAAIGGDVTYTQDQVAQVNAIATLSAIAGGGNGGGADTPFLYSNGGDALGGSTRFFASGGSLFTGDLHQRAGTDGQQGFGGSSGIAGFHGSMQGGTTSTAVDTATVALDVYTADTSSSSVYEGGEQFHDAFVSGGTASISVSGGGSLTATRNSTSGITITTSAVEMGGDTGAADGVAGAVQIQTLTGGTITSANTQITAYGSGGFSSGGSGGDGVGGTITVEANSGAINLGAALIDASADSGGGFSGSAEGRGGSVAIDTANGGLITASGGLSIDTRATIFANNTVATGGTIALTAADGQLIIGGLTANASGNLNNHAGVSNGGAISINATGTSVQSRPSSFGDTDIVTTGATNPGTIDIRNGIADGGSPMSFGILSALASGPATDPLIQLVSVGSAITANSATFNSSGGLFFSSLSDGTFSVANSLTASATLFIQVDLGGGSTTPTVQANTLNFTTNTFNALGTTILRATTDLVIDASGSVTARTLTAGNSIAINSARNVTVDAATVTNAAALSGPSLDPTISSLRIAAGYAGGSPAGPGSITVNSAATARGTVLLKATRDIAIGAAATIRSDNALTLSAGDDISVGTGATVTGAANPINSGTGFASLLAGDGSGPAEVHSLINAGTINANAALLTLTGDAIQSTGTTAGGTINTNLLVGSSTGDDSGTLSADCVAGTICIGSITSTGNVTIGTTGRTPTTTHLTGNVGAAALDVRATGGMFLGGGTPTSMTIAGAANFDAGTQSLSDLGTVGIQAASIGVTAANDIAASATSFQSTGDITLAVGRNIFAADLIAGGRLGPGHVALTGQLSVSGRIGAGTGGIDFTAPGGIALNRVTLGNGTPLTLDAASAPLAITDASPFAGARAGTVSLNGGTITVGKLASAGVIGLTGSGLVQVTTDLDAGGAVTASGAGISLVSVAAPLTIASATSGAGLALTSGGALTLISGNASGTTTLAAGTAGLAVGNSISTSAFTANSAGDISYGSINAGQASLTATNGITGGQLIVTGIGTATFLAGGAIVNIGQLRADGGLSVTGSSVDLTTPGALNLALVRATAGDIALTPAGAVTIGSGIATGSATINGGANVALASFITGGGFTMKSPGTISAGTITSGGAISATAGGGIGFSSIAGTNAALTANGGDINGGALSVAGKAVFQASGAIRLTDPVATGTNTLPNLGLAGVSDSLGNGGDILVNAGGDILISNGVAGGRALLTGGGAVSIGQLRSGGDLTILAPGNIGFTSLAGNAVSLTSTGAAISGDALAASYTTALSSVGLLQVANLSSADLVTGRGSTITLLGTSPLSLASLTSGGAIRIAAGALTINGVIQGTTIDLGSPSIAIGSTARIGTAGTTTGITFRNTGTGRSFIGATGTGYSLATAGLARVQADSITLILPQQAGSSAAQPDVVIGDLTLHGSTGTANGTLANLTSAGSFTVQTPGRIQIAGKLLLTDIAAGNSATITAGQAIDVVTPSGSILLTDTAGGAQGTLTLVAPRVTVASAQAIGDLASLTPLSARDARLARSDGAVTEQGYVVGGHLVFRIADALDIQNSGGAATVDRRGVTGGAGGIDVVATGTATPEVVLNGRQAAAGGGFIAGLDLLPLVHFAATLGTVNPSNAATINGCTATSCLASPGFGAAFTYLPTVPTPQDLVPLVADGGDTAQLLPDVTRPLIGTAETSPFSFAPVVDEPVVGIGTEAIGFNTDSGATGSMPQNGAISTGPENGNGGVPQNGNLSTGPAAGDANGVPQNGNISTGPADGSSGEAAPNGNGPASSDRAPPQG